MTIENLRKFSAQSLGGFPANFQGTRAEYAALSQSQQVALNAAMLSYVRSNPGEFTPAQVAVADARNDISGEVSDTSFDVSAFLSAFGENVENAAGQVGQLGSGVLNTFEGVGKILPFVAVAALVYIVYRAATKATA